MNQLTHRRERYQQGSLTKEKRRSGKGVWVYRWRENVTGGKAVHRKRIIGTTEEFPTRSKADRAVAGLRLDVNVLNAAPTAPVTIAEVAEHYRAVELSSAARSARTIQTYEGYFDNFILPKWGSNRLTDIKAVLVERWLGELEGAPATKSKIRAVFSILFRHAMRYEWAVSNPISLVRQSAKRQTEPVILDVAETQRLLEELKRQGGPFRTLVFVAVVTGLRRGELFGLKWQDVDFARGQIRVVRSLVNGIEGQPKTATSRRPVPLTKELADVLQEWRSEAPYASESDWVFASPHAFGKAPWWPDSVLYKRIRPAALDAGITKRIGWHSFRRTTASLLLSSGASIRTAQELMRHASPEMTLGIYAQSLPLERVTAQAGLAAMLRGEGTASVPNCSHAT